MRMGNVTRNAGNNTSQYQLALLIADRALSAPEATLRAFCDLSERQCMAVLGGTEPTQVADLRVYSEAPPNVLSRRAEHTGASLVFTPSYSSDTDCD